MGFHRCEFCPHFAGTTLFQNTSSGDVNLTFTNGNRWVMPDMILHYVADHNWLPPREFVEDVMRGELADSGRVQTRSMNTIADILRGNRVGYLAGSYEQGSVPTGFVERLELLMRQAKDTGGRAQTKGLG